MEEGRKVLGDSLILHWQDSKTVQLCLQDQKKPIEPINHNNPNQWLSGLWDPFVCITPSSYLPIPSHVICLLFVPYLPDLKGTLGTVIPFSPQIASRGL